jgi:hypothetical protein
MMSGLNIFCVCLKTPPLLHLSHGYIAAAYIHVEMSKKKALAAFTPLEKGL